MALAATYCVGSDSRSWVPRALQGSSLASGDTRGVPSGAPAREAAPQAGFIQAAAPGRSTRVAWICSSQTGRTANGVHEFVHETVGIGWDARDRHQLPGTQARQPPSPGCMSETKRDAGDLRLITQRSRVQSCPRYQVTGPPTVAGQQPRVNRAYPASRPVLHGAVFLGSSEPQVAVETCSSRRPQMGSSSDGSKM